MEPVEAVRVLAGVGLEGDRHATADSPRQVLAVDLEALDVLGLVPGVIRENLALSGVGIQKAPRGFHLRIGEVEFRVLGVCRPCSRMEEIRPGLEGKLRGRRGRLLAPLTDGLVRSGDAAAVTRPGPRPGGPDPSG